jgi:Tfp pilus assembly protein PilN
MRAVNLLPDQHRRRPRGASGVKNGAYAVLGVLGVLLVMALVFTLTANQANSRKTQAAEARQEAERYEAQVAALGAYANFTAVKETRVASVRQLAESRFDWERLLRELSAVLPSGTWLKEASASVTGDTGAAGASATAAPAAPTATAGGGQPGVSLTGCAPAQGDVAKLMVRLRQMYLVQDVELTESARGEGASAPTIDNCGTNLEFNLTVTFEAATPGAPEAPAGKRTVPAHLGGGS